MIKGYSVANTLQNTDGDTVFVRISRLLGLLIIKPPTWITRRSCILHNLCKNKIFIIEVLPQKVLNFQRIPIVPELPLVTKNLYTSSIMFFKILS